MKLFAFMTTVCMVSAAAAAQAPDDRDRDYSFADLADVSLAAPIVARAEIDEAIRIREERAAGVPPGHIRYYVEADLLNLIRSDRSVPAQVTYLVDMPLGPDGRRPDIEGQQVLLMAQPSGRAGELRLVSRHAQVEWTPAREQTVRAILAEASGDDALGAVTGVGTIFSVPGALPGESETQIFLETADNRPVSVSVLRRPGQQPRWSLSLSEIVTQALPPPEPNTLLWYRLACSLPDDVPLSAMEAMDPAQRDRARADYALVIRDLGPCPRYRGESR